MGCNSVGGYITSIVAAAKLKFTDLLGSAFTIYQRVSSPGWTWNNSASSFKENLLAVPIHGIYL